MYIECGYVCVCVLGLGQEHMITSSLDRIKANVYMYMYACLYIIKALGYYLIRIDRNNKIIHDNIKNAKTEQSCQ